MAATVRVERLRPLLPVFLFPPLTATLPRFPRVMPGPTDLRVPLSDPEPAGRADNEQTDHSTSTATRSNKTTTRHPHAWQNTCHPASTTTRWRGGQSRVTTKGTMIMSTDIDRANTHIVNERSLRAAADYEFDDTKRISYLLKRADEERNQANMALDRAFSY